MPGTETLLWKEVHKLTQFQGFYCPTKVVLTYCNTTVKIYDLWYICYLLAVSVKGNILYVSQIHLYRKKNKIEVNCTIIICFQATEDWVHYFSSPSHKCVRRKLFLLANIIIFTLDVTNQFDFENDRNIALSRNSSELWQTRHKFLHILTLNHSLRH